MSTTKPSCLWTRLCEFLLKFPANLEPAEHRGQEEGGGHGGAEDDLCAGRDGLGRRGRRVGVGVAARRRAVANLVGAAVLAKAEVLKEDMKVVSIHVVSNMKIA